MLICDYCETTIPPNTTTYKGFDCTFCSKYCREEIKKLNKVFDHSLSNHELWYKTKPDKIIIENTLKRTESIRNIYLRKTKNPEEYFLTEKNNSTENLNFTEIFKLFKFLSVKITTFTLVISSTVYIYF